MKLEILNNEELEEFFWRHRKGVCLSIKGPPPIGATHDNGEPIVTPVNIGWRNDETGEEIKIIYKEDSNENS